VLRKTTRGRSSGLPPYWRAFHQMTIRHTSSQKLWSVVPSSGMPTVHARVNRRMTSSETKTGYQSGRDWIPMSSQFARSACLLYLGIHLAVNVVSCHAAFYDSVPITSYRQSRYSEVVAQTGWFTCGPAAAATLLTRYYGINSSEREMLEIATDVMEAKGDDPAQGITMLALKQALSTKGIPSKGYRLTPCSLHSYLQQGGLPLILHITKPQPHYVLAVGLVHNQLILADPSFGLRVLPVHGFSLKHGFNGIVLYPVPSPDRIRAAVSKQDAVKTRVKNRLRRLSNLKQIW